MSLTRPPVSEPRESAAALPLDEQVALCSGEGMWHLRAVPSLDLESVMVTDGPHGLRKQDPDDDNTGGIAGVPATCFPTAAALASSWDEALLHEVGAAIGREARAHDVGVVLGPGVNIKRHPYGGRNFEYFSEDPFLSGNLGAAMIEGVQSEGVGTSLKHFALNNHESARMVVDVVADERTMREIYLASFEYAVRRAQPWTVMCAYNKVNGTYCSQHERLLTTILRDEWGFEGLVMTDWGATDDRVAGIRAGLDLEMPGSAGANDPAVIAAVEAGELPAAAVERCASRVVRLIDQAHEGRRGRGTDLDVDAHHALARRAAAECAVLLTNDGVLPLPATADVAVIGEFATKPRYQGAGSSMVTPTTLDTFLDEVRDRAEGRHVLYARGYDADDSVDDRALIDDAVLVARSAETAIVVVGLPARNESEGFDRGHLRLPAQHNELVRAVVAANPNTIVVLCNGSAVQLPWIDQPRAVLEVFLGGQAGGSAIADVVFGDVDPGGRLAETFALRAEDHASDAFFPGESRLSQYREGIHVGYRWFDTAGVPVLFPFGHGLSYTTFAIDGLEIGDARDVDAAGFELPVSVTVTNTGDRRGSEVVQCYVAPHDPSVHRPRHELVGFGKVHLDPGESTLVTITLDHRSFAHWDVASNAWQVDPGRYTIEVGRSSASLPLHETVELASAFVSPPTDPSLDVLRTPTVEAFADDSTFEAQLGHRIPAATPVRPFTPNSMLGELEGTPVGGLLEKLAAGAIAKQFTGDLDPATELMLRSVVREAPLRTMVLMSEGRLGWPALRRFLAIVNRLPSRRRRTH